MKTKYSCLLHFMVVLSFSLMLSSCERQNISRSFEEIVIASPAEDQLRFHDDPHAFMKNVPEMDFQHPDVSSEMSLPDDQNLQIALKASVAKPPLSWKMPKGWTEEKGSGMRLATLRSQGDSGSIECSIVSLGGQAGGIKSNVLRWMNQMNVSISSDEKLKAFLSSQKVVETKGGFSVTVIDLTELSQESQAPSMIAAIAELSDMTIFIKMTGNKNAVTGHRDQFETFCRSLKIN